MSIDFKLLGLTKLFFQIESILITGYILIIMNIKYIIAFLVLFAVIGFVQAEAFTPDEGIFAYREVDVHEINGLNFTVPTDYNVTFENGTEMHFKHDSDRLKISVVKGGEVKKVKKNPSKNVTSGKTMLGSQEGYLVDRNGTYTFSYRDGGKLVVIKSKDMALMMGAMGKD